MLLEKKMKLNKKTGLLLMAVLGTLFSCGCASTQKGTVCFTFDDYHGENWLKADSLFRKYDAHVTFFIMGDISPERAEVMKKLKASGHTIGLHSVHHSHVVNFIRENGMTPGGKYLLAGFGVGFSWGAITLEA